MFTIEAIFAAIPDVLKATAGTALALVGAAILTHCKKRVFGGWAVEVMVDGELKDTEILSLRDGETMLLWDHAWWRILLFGGIPTVKKEREVRQILQSAVTPYGNVTADVRDATRIDATRRRLVIDLKDGINFQRRAPAKPANPKT